MSHAPGVTSTMTCQPVTSLSMFISYQLPLISVQLLTMRSSLLTKPNIDVLPTGDSTAKTLLGQLDIVPCSDCDTCLDRKRSI